MPEILQDFSHPTVVAAIDGNVADCALLYGRSPAVALRHDPELTAVLTGIPHPLLNGVFRARFASGDPRERIMEALLPFQARGLPMMWITGASTRPADLGPHLLAHGFIRKDRPGAGAENPGMAVDLHALNDTGTVPPGLTMAAVADRAGMRQWVDAAVRGFELPAELAGPLVDLFVGVGFDGPAHHYVALWKGKPVATAMRVLGSGVAGIYWVSTVPEARRQGIGTAITLAPLRAAREMGYRIGMLASAPMGYPIYRRIGFEEYCNFSLYLWLGGPQPS